MSDMGAVEKRKRTQNPDEVVDLDALAKEYEDKYGRLGEESPKPKRKNEEAKGFVFSRDLGREIQAFFDQPYEPGYRPNVVGETVEQEHAWAALAHASSLLTILVGLFSAGLLVPFLIFIPLLIFFNFRKRSEFVAQHALQAFAAQIIGTFGWLAVIVISAIIGVVLTVALALTLVGILAIPFLWLALIIFWLATLAMPLGTVFFGVLGALNALQGKTFKYPYVSKLLDRQSH